MKSRTKTTTRQVTTVLYTYQDLKDALNLPENAQIIITPPKDYDEGILIIDEGTKVEAEYEEKSSYSNDNAGPTSFTNR